MINDYKYLFDHAYTAMIIINQAGDVITHNIAFIKLLGYDESDNFVVLRLEEVSPINQHNSMKSSNLFQLHYTKALKEGKNEFTWILKCKDDSELVTEVHLDSIDFNNEPCLLVTFDNIDGDDRIRDLLGLKTKEIQEKNRYLESLFKNTLVGLLVTNEKRVITNANPKFLEIFKYENDSDLIGFDTRKISASLREFENFGKYFEKVFNKGETFKMEHRFRANYNEIIWCTVTGTPLDDSIPPDLKKGCLWVLDDITEKKVMQKKLEELYLVAKDSSPLTGLPGNNTIKKHIKEAIEYRLNKGVLYVDLNNFKAYNDKYGFVKGDEVLLKTAEILLELEEYDTSGNYFVGHIGGDDYVVMTDENAMEAVANGIISKFDDVIEDFYSESDVQSGYIVSKNRSAQVKRFPIMGISVAGVYLKDVRSLNYIEVMDLCAELKSEVKLKVSSAYKFNERKL